MDKFLGGQLTYNPQMLAVYIHSVWQNVRNVSKVWLSVGFWFGLLQRGQSTFWNRCGPFLNGVWFFLLPFVKYPPNSRPPEMGETYRSVDLNTALTCPHTAPLQPGHKGLRVRGCLIVKIWLSFWRNWRWVKFRKVSECLQKVPPKQFCYQNVIFVQNSRYYRFFLLVPALKVLSTKKLF